MLILYGILIETGSIFLVVLKSNGAFTGNETWYIYSPFQCMLAGEGKQGDVLGTVPSAGVERNITCVQKQVEPLSLLASS